MVGTPVTYLPKFNQGLNGYIIVADGDDLYLDGIDFIQVAIEGTPDSIVNLEEKVDLKVLNGYLLSDTAPSCAYAYDSGLIYLYLDGTAFPYLIDTKFIVYGTRTGIPITSLDDLIDVPEKHLELYIKYAIREAAQLLGKIVPPSIEKDIRELETKLGN